MKYFLVLVMFFTLSGCSSLTTTSLSTPVSVVISNVHVIDQRPEKEKNSYRSSPLSPLIFLGDTNIKPKAIEHLKYQLQLQNPRKNNKIQLKINSLRIADYFPVRLSTGIAGALSGQGFTTIPNNTSSDQIIGKLVGELNGEPINIEAATQYQLSVFTGAVRNTTAFKTALSLTISKLASGAWNQVNN